MDAKEKAKELVDKFYEGVEFSSKERAKQCALICVDEILKSILNNFYSTNPQYRKCNRVKDEINKL